MKPASIVISFLLSSAVPALADPMFNFTVTGDGHTFQFTTPNPPSVLDHLHNVDVVLSNLPGSVDGVGGYTYSADILVEEVTFNYPVFTLGVSPSLPAGSSVGLFGRTFTTLVSDVPNPNPECYVFVCNDILTFAFVPGQYSLYGRDPVGNQYPYTLEITTAPATNITPEPPSLLLALTGFAVTGMSFGRQGLADRRRRLQAV